MTLRLKHKSYLRIKRKNMKSTSIINTVLFSIICHSLISQNQLPQTMVSDKNGVELEITDYVKSGTPKIISLWATWCGPCRMELNALKSVYPRWKETYGVEIVAISVDIPPMLGRAKKMFESNSWDFTFLHDKNQELMDKLGIQGIPYSILIDGKGQILSVQTGYYPGYEKELERKLKAL